MRTEIIPFANPDIMARRFAAGLSPIPMRKNGSLPGTTPAPISRKVMPEPQRFSGEAALVEVGAWRAAGIAFIAFLTALWLAIGQSWQGMRRPACKARLWASRPVLVPIWYLGAYMLATTVSFLATMAIFVALM